MPVTLRKFHSPKAQQIVDQVMELAQRYGSDLDQAEIPTLEKQPRKRKSTLKNNHKKGNEQNFKPIGDFGSFVGAQTGS
ncbi:hypothetical protein LCGC14_0456810 [marine sediment metagenome]|uniref:Uncharacterized protein n=1 Tax=marine sediment metagenome TaxID=412755 RepID=A0A0F9SLJ2_9ZZZZ|nr:hypothetical protein [Candidatus Aminicenantes bacterium]